MATDYGEIQRRNFKAARARAGLDHAATSARMRNLGYAWNRSTVSKVERGERSLKAEEIFGLALALETTIARLMAPAEEDKVIELPSGHRVAVEIVRLSATGKLALGAIRWDGNTPVPGEGQAVELNLSGLPGFAGPEG